MRKPSAHAGAAAVIDLGEVGDGGAGEDDEVIPAGPPQEWLPARVRALTGRRPVRLVWRNEAGGLTYAAGGGANRVFLKWIPAGPGPDPAAEAERLRWAATWVSVPRVLGTGADAHGRWLLTAGLAGENAITAHWPDPGVAVAALGRALRAWHDTVPVDRCRFTWSAHDRVALARERARRGLIDPATFHPDHRRLDPAAALRRLGEVPEVDRLVVCHGDACAPNVLVDGSGRISGYVDVGALGTADRWADLAVASWSADWNFGPGRSDALLEAYGVAPDPDRIAFYRLLWDLGP